jgi:hypothetical protein
VNAYLRPVPRKPLELPLSVTRAFVEDMKRFLAEPHAIKCDEIAARQLTALRAYQRPREKKLRITDVHEMFQAMKDQA